MAEITNKRVGELQRGVFKILLSSPDGLPAREVLEKLEREVPPTQFESSEYPSRAGSRRYDKIVRFATVGCVKAGWLEKSKGRRNLTDLGRDAFHRITDPEEFRREINKLYRVWESTNKDFEESIPEQFLAQQGVNVSFERADEDAWAEIQDYLSKIDPYDFQNKIVVGLLKGMGYHVYQAAPPGADGGIDIIAYPDPLGTKEPTIKVSVRRRVQKADVKDLREFLSNLHGTDVGIFVSVSGFTSEAEKGSRAEQRRVRLVDLERLFSLWAEHYNTIPEHERNYLRLKPVWFLAEEED